MMEYEATYDKICRGQELGQVIFPGLQNYTTALTLCQNVRGNLVQLETEAQQQKAVDLLTNSSICSNSSINRGTWMGWSDDDQEGNWVSALNSSVSLGKEQFQPWRSGQPNGERKQNCLTLKTNGRYTVQPTANHTIIKSCALLLLAIFVP